MLRATDRLCQRQPSADPALPNHLLARLGPTTGQRALACEILTGQIDDGVDLIDEVPPIFRGLCVPKLGDGTFAQAWILLARQNRYSMTIGEQRFGQRGADEAGAASYEHMHCLVSSFLDRGLAAVRRCRAYI